MNSDKYRSAFTEINEILKETDENVLSKIPLDVKKFIEENINENYNFIIDPNFNIEDQISEDTKVIISWLYRDYIMSNEEKINTIRNEENNFKMNEENIYNGINKKEENIQLEENMSLIKYKKIKWYDKIICFFKEKIKYLK